MEKYSTAYFINQDMSFENSQAALKLIREVFQGSPGKDDYTLRRIHSACARLRSDAPTNGEMISEIEHWAEIYLSQRKWKQYTDAQRQIPCWVRDRCSWIQSRLDAVGQNNKSPHP
jgi:hypothetical protein